MNLFDKTLQGIYDIRRAIKGEPRLLHTKFGDIILADKTTRRNAQHIISKLQRTTEALTKVISRNGARLGCRLSA